MKIKLINSLLRLDIDTLTELKDKIESVEKTTKNEMAAILIKFKDGRFDAYYLYLSDKHRNEDLNDIKPLLL